MHSTFETLHQKVPKEILPEEYGGTAGKLQDFHGNNFGKIQNLHFAHILIYFRCMDEETGRIHSMVQLSRRRESRRVQAPR